MGEVPHEVLREADDEQVLVVGVVGVEDRPVAGDGRHERFKSTQFFDGIHHQRQHGLTKGQIEGT